MAPNHKPRALPIISRVYFIGAGFSAGVRYPVGSSLVPSLMHWLRERRFRGAHDREASAYILDKVELLLARYLGVRLQLRTAPLKELKSAFQKVNVAEFYTTAHALAEMPMLFELPGSKRKERQGQEDSMVQLYSALSAATRTYFNVLSDQFTRLPIDMQRTLQFIDPNRHAVVNFNWDEEVDMWMSTTAGANLDLAFTFRGWRKNRTYIHLKPHGSIGWYDVGQGIGNKDAYFIAEDDDGIPRTDRRLVAYYQNELPIDIDGATHHPVLGCPPIITPPTFAKRFDYREQQQIWQDVITVCKSASEFVFLGYSLAADDYLTRAAIRSALHDGQQRAVRCLFVSNACDAARQALFASVFPGFTPERHFLDWRFGTEGRQGGLLGDLIEDRLRTAVI